ncbi:hypothetical protein [Dyella sp. M7H15-1]|uniref:IS66 family insertion sequence element accessory protein TnpA n=1 Tax=Dyella sp. M7H15-1 TaxID=2501295 RepID=UPI0013E8B8C9|nr:hypothetical protein [Dyella sp. M7H15-1]
MGKRTKTEATLQHEAMWRDRLQHYEASGKKAADFCRAEGISAWSFYPWHQRLKQRDKPLVKEERSVPFLDLCTLASSAPRAPGLEIRFDLGGGLVLTIARH